jgi:hypothetical protein
MMHHNCDQCLQSWLHLQLLQLQLIGLSTLRVRALQRTAWQGHMHVRVSGALAGVDLRARALVFNIVSYLDSCVLCLQVC